MVELPADLIGPVELELAKVVEDVLGPHALPGGSRYEVKTRTLQSLIDDIEETQAAASA